MDDSHSIIDLGKLAEPATALVNKISDAIGGIARPWQIVRVAEAQAEADKIKAISKIEISDIQDRALRRLVLEEAKKQNNIESIIAKALPQVTEESKPLDVEDDWIANFFDKCRLISDEDMQKLWAKVLAGESNQPGTFSKRTISVLAALDKSDAMMFTQLCGFNTGLGPLIYDTEHKIYQDRGIDFSSVSHLDTIGLINFSPLGYSRQNLPSRVTIGYFDAVIYIEFPNAEVGSINLGRVLLTNSGFQLSRLCDAKPVEGFVDYVREKWKSLGYKIEPPSAVPGE
jgi:hypothetical protein